MKKLKCKLVRGEEVINRHMSMVHLCTELKAPILISVESKENKFSIGT